MPSILKTQEKLNMKHRMIATTLAAALLSGAVLAAQQGDDRGPGPDGRPGMTRRGDDRHPDRRMPPPPPHERRFGRGGPGHMHRGMHAGMGMAMGVRMQRLMDLDLTAEQRAKVVDTLTASYKAMLEARFQMMGAARKLRDAKRDKLGEDEIIAAHRDMGEAMGRLQVLKGKAAGAIRDILTDEQKANFDKPTPRPRHDRGPGMRHRDDDRRFDRDRPRFRDRRDDDRRWDRRPPRRWHDRDFDDDGDMADDLLDDDIIED
jgi:Spy/CpxP family protein refolding chaperone